MSMAEPKRRRKWTLNPRGSLWANDDNKFGQKLMEKMGWSKGSGLGREEQGIKEHLTVKFKDDSKGIGFKGSDDEWIKHYEGFESVLASLNSQENITSNASSDGQPDQSSVAKTSLESSSKASKARVHYHKFTRGKDLSRLSEDDLGCILGSKRAKRLAEVKTTEEDMTQPDDAVGTMEHSMGVTTIKGCSIQEYFAQKMEALKNGIRPQSQPQEGGNESASEETIVRPGFGASSGGDETSSAPVAEGVGKKKKKKRKKKIESENTDVAESEEKSENCIEHTENVTSEETIKKPGFDVSNGGDDTSNAPVAEGVGKKKKKKRRKQVETKDTNVAGSEEKSENCVEVTEKIPSKKRKKKQLKLEDADVVESEEKFGNSDEETENIPSKKKKKKQFKSDDTNIAKSEEKSENCNEETENLPSKKKKKRKGIHLSAVNGNVCEDMAVESSNNHMHNGIYDIQDTPISNGEPRKKKKKKHTDNANEEGSISCPAVEESTKIKKKRKHLDVSEESLGSHSEVQDNEIKKKKKERKNKA